MRLDQALQKFQRQLAHVGVDNPSLDTRLLASHVLNCDRVGLIANPERDLTEMEFGQIETLINRRAQREPVARILGEREFWGLSFAMNEATLEPRPDSETLIQAALNAVSKPEDTFSILDLGTGTGCLLLAFLSEWPLATGVGIDLSPQAVAQATANADRLGFSDRATFRSGNWAEGTTQSFDLIISNPPYIPSADIKCLQKEVKLFDPIRALDGGKDGLDPYRSIIPKLANILNPEGFIFFEVGIHQAPKVAQYLCAAGFLSVTTTRDLGGIERIVHARRGT
ncbi:MAG: peptide chain release factor N(5)-glutamine methyltransferase [Alphaproteobacteria bacterium]|nr:peptide chain release factor N(5)-glutamine methyltransferase [Alphaproteobacteria bacterium]